MTFRGSASIGLFLVGIVVLGLLRWWQGVDSVSDDDVTGDLTSLPPSRPARTSSGPERLGFAAIRHADPHFDLESFYGRVSEMFLAYHAAVAKRDLVPVRRFIDERFYPALLAQLRTPATAAQPGRDLVVEHARGLTATHESGMDEVRVLITAADGTAPGSSRRFLEYWTLIRRQGAVTRADLSLHKCPNCGGPTDGDDPTRCAYCGARLADPALDWVVTRIDAD